MNQKELKQQIKENRLDSFYIFCSDDYFMKRVYVEAISKKLELDIERVELGSFDDIDRLKTYGNSKDLFNSRRKLIYVRLMDEVLSSFNAADMNFYNVVILDPMGCKDRGLENMVLFEPPKASEIDSFVEREAKKHKKRIEHTAKAEIVRLFKSKSASSLSLFLDKLFLYDMDKDNIIEQDILDLIDYSYSADIFGLIELLINGNRELFFKNIDSLLNEYEPFAIIGILASEIVKIAASGYLDKDEVKSLKVYNHYNRYKHYFNNIGFERLSNLLSILYEMDLIVKSQSLSGFAELFKARMFKWFMQG